MSAHPCQRAARHKPGWLELTGLVVLMWTVLMVVYGLALAVLGPDIMRGVLALIVGGVIQVGLWNWLGWEV